MLQKRVRKRLSEQNWIDMLERESNPSLTAKRLVGQAQRAINDLTLLARKMPNERLSNVFMYDNLKGFIEAILQSERKVHERNFDSRTTQLAALLVNLGIEYCKHEYEQNVEQHPSLNRATKEKLDAAVEICDAVALKSHSNPLSHYKGGLIYLFNWNNIQSVLDLTDVEKVQGEDNLRLLDYLNYEFGKIRKIKINPSITRKPPRISCHLITEKNSREIDCLFYTRNVNDKNVFLQAFDMTNQRYYGKSWKEDMFMQISDLITGNALILEKNLIVNKEANNLLVYRQA
jgi:hypothetical protein